MQLISRFKQPQRCHRVSKPPLSVCVREKQRGVCGLSKQRGLLFCLPGLCSTFACVQKSCAEFACGVLPAVRFPRWTSGPPGDLRGSAAAGEARPPNPRRGCSPPAPTRRPRCPLQRRRQRTELSGGADLHAGCAAVRSRDALAAMTSPGWQGTFSCSAC